MWLLPVLKCILEKLSDCVLIISTMESRENMTEGSYRPSLPSVSEPKLDAPAYDVWAALILTVYGVFSLAASIYVWVIIWTTWCDYLLWRAGFTMYFGSKVATPERDLHEEPVEICEECEPLWKAPKGKVLHLYESCETIKHIVDCPTISFCRVCISVKRSMEKSPSASRARQ